MKLLRKLGTRTDKNGYKRSWAEFLCKISNCGKIVERKLSDGKKQKSCGCNKSEFISKLNKGKDFSGENNPFYDKNHTEESKQKNREFHLGKEPWNKGKINVYSQETLDKMSKTRIEKGISKGENNYWYGKSFLLSGKSNPNYGNGDKIRGINNPMYGVHRYGELSPNWNNGSSFEPYSPKFNKELKQSILERDNYTCQCPNCLHLSEGLDVHHIDYDKQNNSLDNLTTLCDSCHSKTNGKNKRQYWTEFYQNIMMSKIVECLL